MPSTIARNHFDSWTSDKQCDDLLTVHQLDIVLHFLDTLYTEFHMEIEMRTFQDKSALLSYLLHLYPDQTTVISAALQVPFDSHVASELQRLQDMVKALLHTLSRQSREPTSWLGKLSEANLHLADLILTATPIEEVAQDEFIP